jgi:hypothetical protein
MKNFPSVDNCHHDCMAERVVGARRPHFPSNPAIA